MIENAPSSPQASEPLLRIRDLAVSFDLGGGRRVQAVDGLSLTVYPGQTLAVVGESGCGKSVSALSTLQLIPRPPGRYDRGSIWFDQRDLLTCTEREMLDIRGGDIAMIFQEPMTSLNPVYSVGDQIIEAIRLHQRVNRSAARAIAVNALGEVGIANPAARLDDFPHQFSGGMRQRVMIAMALACQPRLLLADEPTTALDVTIQAQILNLLRQLQGDRGMAILLISHDLHVVAENSDAVCVMYDGKVVEYAGVDDLFARSHHPYTQALISCIPRVGERKPRLSTIDDIISNPERFRRLPGYQYGIIPWWPQMEPPATVDVRAPYCLHEIEPGHWVGCWRTEYLRQHPNREPKVMTMAATA